MRKTLVLPIAGLLAVGAAGAALAASSSTPATVGTETVVPAAESASPSPSDGPIVPFKDTLLSDVLDELVDKGTINDTQKSAILDALDTRRTELREQRQAAREQLQRLWADGQITQEEIDQLPADSPLRTLTNLLDDGKITTDELRSLGRGFGFGFGGRGGFGPGFGGRHGMWDAPFATPAPSDDASGSSG